MRSLHQIKMAGTRVIFNSLTRKFSAQVKAGSSADTGHAANAEILWKRISFFVGLPACVLCAINTYIKHKEHESDPRPEFIPYDHMYVRTKRFPWGDGQHSFFHNPHANPLPTGWEDEH